MDELNLAARQKSRDDIYYSERACHSGAMIQDIARSNLEILLQESKLKYYYRASQVLARVGFLYLRFLTIQLQQAHPPTVDAHELHRVALTRHLNEILRGVAF